MPVLEDPAAGAQDDDLVEIDDGLEAVGDGEDGAVCEGVADDLLHKSVGVDVDAAERRC